jgi:hypothetical protein
MDPIRSLIELVDRDRISERLFHLAKHPLPCRSMNYTIPGHDKCTLYEADDYITSTLGAYGYQIETEAVPVQAYRIDRNRPNIHHLYAAPEPSDPWYDAFNLYAKKEGKSRPDEVIVVISHKDSQSWHGCVAGAYDNAAGTAANMEMAAVLAEYESERSIWFVYCNEEHTPWTSAVVAQNLAESSYYVVAALNIDGLGGKSQDAIDRGVKTNVTGFTTPEGEALADMMAVLNDRYRIGLYQTKYAREFPNDDDGSFIKAGMPRAVINLGSFPYEDPNYHLDTDTPENVDIENVHMATKLSLAAIVQLDRTGAAGTDPCPRHASE